MKPMTLYDHLRAAHVKRWHNVNVAREQTVAEHSWMVAFIALQLFNNSSTNVQDDRVSALNLVIGALVHDSPEIVTGDFPSPAKLMVREITKDWREKGSEVAAHADIFDLMDAMLMPELPFLGIPLPPELAPYIKLADAIDAAHWISENGLGAHAKVVAHSNRRKLEDMVEHYETTIPNGGWYDAVNRVLVALGDPYVHRQSRLSPP